MPKCEFIDSLAAPREGRENVPSHSFFSKLATLRRAEYHVNLGNMLEGLFFGGRSSSECIEVTNMSSRSLPRCSPLPAPRSLPSLTA